MNTIGSLRDVENLRFRVQMNNRLRLECLAAVSKVFREFEEPINDELLSSMVFALPQELISSNGHDSAQVNYQAKEGGNPPQKPEKPALPPQGPKPQEPGLPPQGPKPQEPGLPPQSPGQDAPALPPQQPEQAAIS